MIWLIMSLAFSIACLGPVRVHGLSGWPPQSGAICILQPDSACRRLICSPPRPMIRPTILSGTLHSSTAGAWFVMPPLC
uniref:Putative secreted protein n=1 Tax=Ixodes ricinus TaxID=34613 RepID=A0A6B0U0V1_IXORI